MDENAHDGETGASTVDPTALAVAREESALWQAHAASLQTQLERAEETCASLREQVHTLTAQLRALEAYTADVQTRLAQTESLLAAAQSAAATAQPAPTAVPPPNIIDIVDTLPRSSDLSNQYPQRTLAQIRHLVIHHTGTDDSALTPQAMADFQIKDPKHQWPGIGFHFFIAADGTTYQTNRMETACYHVPHHNADSVGIVLAGQFSGKSPSPAQLASTAALLAWLVQELRLPPDSIIGHSEFSDQDTDCPGMDWQGQSRWKDALLQHVRQRTQAQPRPIYHYVLLWQTATSWAEADWQAVARYVGRFRPAVGFSGQEALQAEHVTIIGGPDGVPMEVEQMLRAAGCRVQRVAGKNAKQTRALLDTMARDGQRFLP